jgi:hypothetical protein
MALEYALRMQVVFMAKYFEGFHAPSSTVKFVEDEPELNPLYFDIDQHRWSGAA